MKPVQQPPALGMLITLAMIVAMLTVSFVLMFASYWFIGVPMFLAATFIFHRLRRTVHRYDQYCQWLEGETLKQQAEDAEMLEIFENVLADWCKLEGKPRDEGGCYYCLRHQGVRDFENTSDYWCEDEGKPRDEGTCRHCLYYSGKEDYTDAEREDHLRDNGFDPDDYS